MTATIIPIGEDAAGWERALYAFLAKKERRSGSRRTVEGHSRTLQHFFGTMGKPPDKVTSQEVFTWAYGRGLSGKEPSAIAIGLRLGCLSSFYRFLIRMEILSANPCDQIERPKASPSPPRGISAEGLASAAFVAFCHGRNFPSTRCRGDDGAAPTLTAKRLAFPISSNEEQTLSPHGMRGARVGRSLPGEVPLGGENSTATKKGRAFAPPLLRPNQFGVDAGPDPAQNELRLMVPRAARTGPWHHVTLCSGFRQSRRSEALANSPSS